MIHMFFKKQVLGKIFNFVSCLSVIAAASLSTEAQNAQLDGPFIPPNGQKLMIIGQDTLSIDNYRASVPIEPAGVTTYIALSDLSGLITRVDNGGGPNNAGYLQANYPNSIHAIAVYIKGIQAQAANGALEANMDELVRILKSWERPVLLRFGYEADGPWNENDPDLYVQAFRRMHDRVTAGGANNIAMVWQVASYCGGTYQGRNFTDWYPGDNYVDWLAFSYFTPQDCNNSAINNFMNFANTKNKPVFIAESAPQRYDIEGGTYNSQVQRRAPDQPKSGDQIWNEWFVNYFNFINSHDKIRMVAYINADWDSQSLWQAPYPEGYWGDTRVEKNSIVQNNWVNEITGSDWIQSSSDLFDVLTDQVAPLPRPTATPNTRPTATPNTQPTQTPIPGTDIRLEAENGNLLGSATLYSDASASNGQGVAFISSQNAGFSLSNVPASNAFSIWYASVNSGKISIRINGSDLIDVPFSTTGGWTGNYSSVSVNQSISEGASVDVFFDNGDAAINVDFLEFTTSGIPTPRITPTPINTPTPRTSPTPITGNRIYIVHKPTGFKLYSCGSRDGDFVRVVENTSTNECAKWRRKPNGSYFYLENTGGKYIRPATGADGSAIELRPNTWIGNWAQWSYEDRGDGYGHLKNRGTGKYMFIPSKGLGETVQQQPSSWRGDYTRWRFENTN